MFQFIFRAIILLFLFFFVIEFLLEFYQLNFTNERTMNDEHDD